MPGRTLHNPGDGVVAERLLREASAAHQRGDYDAALALYEQVLTLQPGNFSALHSMGVLVAQKGDFGRASDLIRQATECNPLHAEAWSNLGFVLREFGQPARALECYDRAIALDPQHSDAYYNQGIAFYSLKQYQSAVESYDRAIALRPHFADAYNNRGVALNDLMQYQEAVESYDRAIAIRPAHSDAQNNRSVSLALLQQQQMLSQGRSRNIAADSDGEDAWYSRGNSLYELRRLQEALECYDRVIALNPNHPGAFYSRGNTLYGLKRAHEAAISYEKAIALNPQHTDSYNNRGVALYELKRYSEALESYEKAIALNPQYAGVYSNRGVVLYALQQYQKALEAYQKAIELNPRHADAYSNRGLVLRELKQYQEALECYDRALEINPQHAEAWNNRAEALYALKRYEDALASYDKALALNPDGTFWLGMQMLVKMKICDWHDYDALATGLAEKVKRRQKVAAPFIVLAMMDALVLQQVAAEILVEARFPSNSELPAISKYAGHEKIRIGYFSADFYNHATAYLMAEMFERHDRSKFEFTAFSFGPDSQDEYMRRVSKACDRFVDVRHLSDRQVAELSRTLEIDIAIDLKGYTTDARPGIFSYRTAPTQVNYLGYPGTMGADYIDFLIADPVLIPESSRKFYNEKIVYLPDSYQVNDSNRVVSDKVYTREELGLPETGFVFCCFNDNYKITPSTFDCWMRILKQVEGSVLWLLEDNAAAARNLRMEAVQRGVNADRLIFAKRLSFNEHLARQQRADLFLDTFPCNAHTTASDALWVGLPLLTRSGESFASRVAASLLQAMQLPELITTTEEEYEARAVELAHNSKELKKIVQKLKKSRKTTPLFNAERFTRNIEAAYLKMYEPRLRSGETNITASDPIIP